MLSLPQYFVEASFVCMGLVQQNKAKQSEQ